ncbi:MAG: hypothetical protein AB7M93_26050 [Candidatus Obscuribacterales bacterium]
MYLPKRPGDNLDPLMALGATDMGLVGRLPLFDAVFSNTQGVDLKDVVLIGVQHLLPTTRLFLRHLVEHGLQPQNVYLLGKCYSTIPWVYNALQSDGFNVSPLSFKFDSGRPFDSTFRSAVHSFIKSINFKRISASNRCIVLDDGGALISNLLLEHTNLDNVSAVEQTSSGYRAIKDLSFKIPIINVARAEAKLAYESPFIAKAIVSSVFNRLYHHRIYQIKRAIVIGCGPIGREVARHIGSHTEILLYDHDPSISLVDTSDLNRALPSSDLVIGCTGSNSLSEAQIAMLQSPAVLASGSSSDREFNASALRRRALRSRDCHTDIRLHDGPLLLNSGFPINFTGQREIENRNHIQLTRCLLAAGIFQALRLDGAVTGIVTLDTAFQQLIINNFLGSAVSMASHIDHLAPTGAIL